jgi:hypothetical protein
VGMESNGLVFRQGKRRQERIIKEKWWVSSSEADYTHPTIANPSNMLLLRSSRAFPFDVRLAYFQYLAFGQVI